MDRKWGGDAVGTSGGTVTWSMNLAGLVFVENGAEPYAMADYEKQVRRAFDTWAAVADIDFQEVDEGADVILYVSDDSRPDDDALRLRYPENDFGTRGATIGIAWSGSDSPNDNGIRPMEVGEILFDQAELWSPTGQQDNSIDFFAVALHEIGHIIGLDHIVDDQSIMNAFIAAGQAGEGDVAGAKFIYGDKIWGTADDIIDLSGLAAGQEVYALDGADLIFGSTGDDQLFGDGGNDDLRGGGGNDNIFGGNGADLIIDSVGRNNLYGDEGNDTIIGGGDSSTARGDLGDDLIIGGSGDDALFGGEGNDSLRGDIQDGFFFGDDRLEGGVGDDMLEGGMGADQFVFGTNEGDDIIGRLTVDIADPTVTSASGRDFTPGVDKIILEDFGYGSGNEVLDYIVDVGADSQFSDQGTTITLIGVNRDDLSFDDFIITADNIA